MTRLHLCWAIPAGPHSHLKCTAPVHTSPDLLQWKGKVTAQGKDVSNRNTVYSTSQSRGEKKASITAEPKRKKTIFQLWKVNLEGRGKGLRNYSFT